MRSSHWNWERTGYIEGRGLASIGKKNIINNFCIGASANEQACAKCHIGFGMTNDHFDFNNAVNVDCMVCHDNSDEYLKGSAMAGYPARSVNLRNVALSVGPPQKSNCGVCHFYSGGGNNVKHGDLEESLLACDKEVDVHMAANGMDMSCVTCHTAENHVMKGRLYSVSSDNKNRAFCEDCHTDSPHLDDLLNRHVRVACQTCHIPYFAKVNATKMAWRWSQAGKLKDGKPYSIENEDGEYIYLSTKGEFTWEKNVEFARHDEIELVAMTDCGDCPGLTFPKVKLLNEITGILDRPFEILHLGTCMKLAMETADCPIDFDDLKATLESKFGIEVVLGTHSY